MIDDLQLATSALVIISCVIIVWRTEPAMARMSRATALLIRLAFWTMATAAMAEIACIVTYRRAPTLQELLLYLGVAELLLCERRLRFLARLTCRWRR